MAAHVCHRLARFQWSKPSGSTYFAVLASARCSRCGMTPDPPAPHHHFLLPDIALSFKRSSTREIENVFWAGLRAPGARPAGAARAAYGGR
ncbi:hypothetical protein EVAR_381_1 [Eumeta japonica]|uniref:Uncharacterized protein n=1 Tax=Eumeta variegata TaxID=151549 RepID=A0A4C1SA77_EUMVA|nr:hypothetical protein EVAR_381_1 [Eumeta japonica]